jgi:hypothetical protein
VARGDVQRVDRPVGMAREVIRAQLERAPKITQEPVGVVDRLGVRLMGSCEHDSSAATKGLDVVFDITEALPDE